MTIKSATLIAIVGIIAYAVIFLLIGFGVIKFQSQESFGYFNSAGILSISIGLLTFLVTLYTKQK